MAKWEIIEDNKFKKGKGGKAAASRTVPAKRTAAKAATNAAYATTIDAADDRKDLVLKSLQNVASDADNAFWTKYDKSNETNTYVNDTNKIKLNTGRFTGANVPSTLIDDLASAANKNNIPVGQMLALAGRESTFGIPTKYSNYANKAEYVSGWNVSDQYTPYNLYRFLADKKVPGIKTLKSTHGWGFIPEDKEKIIDYTKTHPELIDEYKSKIAKTLDVGDKNVYDLAAIQLKNKGIQSYNPSDPNYVKMFQKDYDSLKQDKNLMDYLQKKGYDYENVTPQESNQPVVLPTQKPGQSIALPPQFKHGGVIEDPMGQWAHPGSVTRIPSNQITMQGVNYPVLGVSDRGHTQMMYPGEDYSFRGRSVTEYPMMQDGGRYTDWKNKYGLQETSDYNLQRAFELGYVPDETGHLPSVDSETGEWLKSDTHSTRGMEMMESMLNPDVANNSRLIRNEKGKMQYVPKSKYGGEVNFTYAGENHRVYEKESPTGNGKGIEGHIMVNHPTENKKRWDTIDLTKITNGRVKTVAQGVASTKKWHKENPEYATGGKVVSEIWEETTGLPWSEAKKLGLTKGGYEENLKLRSELLKNPDKFTSIAKNNIPVETITPITNTNLPAYAPIEPIQNTLKPVEPVLNNTNVPKPIINNTNPIEPITIEPEPNLLSEIGVIDYLEPSRIKQQRDIIQATRPKHNYAITDKVTNKIYYYDPSGKIIKSEPVITGKSNNDVDKGLSMADWFKQTGSSSHEDYFKYLEKNKYQTTPSGIYSISGVKNDTASDPSKLGKFINFFRPKRAKEIYDARIRDYGEKQKMFTLTNEQGKGSSKAIHGTANPVREKALEENIPTGENRNLSNGCINVNGETICFETLEKKSKMYILPEENTNLLYPKSKNKLFQKQNDENSDPYKMASAYKMGADYKMGGMIKRADGSYSQRGLWDNIRDNAGSGKTPTKEMLKQERKIKSQYANGGQVSFWEILEDLPKAQTGILTPKDSLYHQRDKTIKYDLLRGHAQGTPLPQYSNTAHYNQFYKDSVEPKLKYYPTAMEKGDAGDFIFNTGKDPRVFAYQEYLRKTDPTNKTGWADVDNKWKDRKNLPPDFDQIYQNTIGKLPENERRVAINNGRDWYYKNTWVDDNDKWKKGEGKEEIVNGKTAYRAPDGSLSSAYGKTWYGRIWNNNDFKEFDPNNPKFTPPAQKPGQSVALPPQFQKGGKTNIPIYVNDPKDPRLQMYSDSLSNYNKNEIFFKDYQPLTPAIAEQIKTSYQSGLVYKKRNNPNLPGYDVVYKNIVKKPTQPYILKLQDHAQEQINMPTMGNINSDQQIAQQISQPIINIPTVIPPKKDYVTIKTGSSYRNPETGAFQQKSYKIDKGTGKKVSEETFKNGGKTKKSSWQIIEY